MSYTIDIYFKQYESPLAALQEIMMMFDAPEYQITAHYEKWVIVHDETTVHVALTKTNPDEALLCHPSSDYYWMLQIHTETGR